MEEGRGSRGRLYRYKASVVQQLLAGWRAESLAGAGGRGEARSRLDFGAGFSSRNERAEEMLLFAEVKMRGMREKEEDEEEGEELGEDGRTEE